MNSKRPDFQLLFESAPGLYLVLLPDEPRFTVVAVSDAYLAATMTARDRILGRGLFEIFPDNPAASSGIGERNLGDSLSRAIRSREHDAMAVQKYDIRRPESEGGGFEVRYWSPLNTPVLQDGEVAFLIHAVQDVTDFVRLREKEIEQEQMAAELRTRAAKTEAEVLLRAQQVQEANRRLRNANEELTFHRIRESQEARAAFELSERRYRTLVSATSSIVWTRDPEGAFVELQPSWAAYTGQEWEEYKGWGWLKALHPDDRERVRDAWRQVVSSGGTFEVEARIWHAQSRAFRYFVGRGAPVTGADGALREWIGTVHDINDRKHLEEQLRHAAKLESLGVLAGGIAHDFNNLLTGIMGNASLALELFGPRYPADRVILEGILSASERAAHLTRQMLAYSGKGTFQIQELDLPDLVREIATLVQSSIPKRVQLRLELESASRITADPGQIQQVVMNLIINAAEAVAEGENGSVNVSVCNQVVDEEYARHFETTGELKPGSYVSLEVQDSGVGMDEETVRRIFDPFFTTKVHGRGLGLSAVLGIVRGHNGGLRVYTNPGKGTSFKVLFPASVSNLEAAPPERADEGANSLGTVVVIDDEKSIRETIRMALQRKGYSVEVAADGPAGLRVLEQLGPRAALIILDLTMPQMSGEETLRHLRAIRADIPVILTSGYSATEATRKFAGKSLSSFLQKPFNIQRLYASVEAALKEAPRSSAAN